MVTVVINSLLLALLLKTLPVLQVAMVNNSKAMLSRVMLSKGLMEMVYKKNNNI
jgi:hypothetical protein